MKILLLSPLPPPNGGIATWTKSYLKSCKAYKIEADIVNTASIGKRALQLNTSMSIKDEIIRTKNILGNLIRRLRKEKYDIVHINTSCNGLGIYRDLLCCFIAKWNRKKVLIHCHCNLDFQVKGAFSRLAFRGMIRSADRVIVLNKNSERFAKRYDRDKAAILPNFIEPLSFNLPFQVREDIKKVIFVGHVQFSKGFREIHEAAGQLKGLEFLLIGPVKEEVREFPVLPNLKFLGEIPHEKIAQELIKADIFLFPSYTEGFACALLEAMACGLPVIASDVGANRDMIEDKGGIIVPARDSKGLISAIQSLNDQEVRERMSAWNCRKVESEYTVSAVMSKLSAVYSNILSVKNG